MKLAAVLYLSPALRREAQALGARFGVPVADASDPAAQGPRRFKAYLGGFAAPGEARCVFLLNDERLELFALGQAYGVGIHADFHGPTVTYRRKCGGGRGQSISKAVGLRSGVTPRVLDATAGLGGDAFVLASLGCEVVMLERVSVVRALLEDGLARARLHGAEADAELVAVLDRMTLRNADAVDYMQTLSPAERPDVVYLDPMFPVRSKQAKVKKEMRVFHSLVGADADADRLLDAALGCARHRVVVKRPRVAPALKGPPPNHVLEGRSNRFDVYALKRMERSAGE